jgi:uncharacterized protein (DUF608 family)
MSMIRTRIPESSGIPLGGIGAGTVELRPNGGFYDWQELYQLGEKPHSWPTNRSEVYAGTPNPDMPPDALSFVVRTQTPDAEPIVRRLSVLPDEGQTLYSASWLKSVEEIAFEQRFPTARLTYTDSSLPVDVTSEFTSPFIPHDAQTSGVPGFYSTYRIVNPSDEPVDVSILARLCNPIHYGLSNRELVNHTTVLNGTAYLDMTTEGTNQRRPTTGSMTLAASGGDLSWVSGEYRNYMGIGASVGTSSYGTWHQGLFCDFRDGLAGFASGLSNAPSQWRTITDEEVDLLDISAAGDLAEQLCSMPYAADIRRRVLALTPDAFSDINELKTFIKTVLAKLSTYGGPHDEMWGDGALIVSAQLAPGEEREFQFTLAWHFPFHYAANETLIGHMYENWYADAGVVCRSLVDRRDEIAPIARRFADTLYQTDVDEAYPNAWSGQLGTLIKCSWWNKNGRFGIWEGLRCCGFHTMDISYQGSFSLLALFPELEKTQMDLSSLFQRDDGRIPHLLAIDLLQVDDDFERVDMNPQFVMLTCRDWMWTGDRAYLERQWPTVVSAIDNMLLLDGDGDGLPDHSTRKNTYDNWNFYGTPSYIASLWLSAFAAAIRMAEDMGDSDRVAEWTPLRTKAMKSFDEKLWNGEYYSLWVDGESRDECCMTDQIDGEWFARIVGLPPGISEDRIIAVSKAIMAHNYTDESGLLNAAYPCDFTGKKIHHTYRTVQAQANWTGIEYLFAALLHGYSNYTDALTVVQNIENRHARAGRLWDHLECGDHYYRAMSSWTLMLGATGFIPDVPMNRLTIAPPVGDVRAPWASSTGWGYLEQCGGTLTIGCEGGTVEFGELRTTLPVENVSLNSSNILTTSSKADALTSIQFNETIALTQGDVLACR